MALSSCSDRPVPGRAWEGDHDVEHAIAIQVGEVGSRALPLTRPLVTHSGDVPKDTGPSRPESRARARARLRRRRDTFVGTQDGTSQTTMPHQDIRRAVLRFDDDGAEPSTIVGTRNASKPAAGTPPTRAVAQLRPDRTWRGNVAAGLISRSRRPRLRARAHRRPIAVEVACGNREGCQIVGIPVVTLVPDPPRIQLGLPDHVSVAARAGDAVPAADRITRPAVDLAKPWVR